MTEKRIRDDVPNNENGTEVTETRGRQTIADVLPKMTVIVTKDSTAKVIDTRGFQLLGDLGKGGFGVVKKALWTKKNDKEVAVKILKLEKTDGEKKKKGTRLTDVKHEIETMEKLRDHNTIISLFDYFAVNDDVVIVMELADAKTLMEEIRKRNFVDERKIGRWFWELCDAVNYMHAKGIAHRDLKLDNVLLKKPEAGRKGHRSCRVVDFGLSRSVFDPEKGIQMFAGHAGTRPYMAPEICAWSVDKENAVKYNPMYCDIWALGVCLFCMLTKNYPFETVKTAAALENLRERGAKVKQIDNKEIRDLVLSMLEPIPSKRITTRGIMSYKWAVENNGIH